MRTIRAVELLSSLVDWTSDFAVAEADNYELCEEANSKARCFPRGIWKRIGRASSELRAPEVLSVATLPGVERGD
jgi:hypothetical protein